MDAFYQVLIVVIPAGLVLLTAYLVLKKFTEHQTALTRLQMGKEISFQHLQIKLQAYERLTLFLERIDIPSLLLRLRMSTMTNSDLHQAILIAIEKEYEHNMVQQLYVSDELWKIIKLAKDTNISLISQLYERTDGTQNGQQLSDMLMKSYTNIPNPIPKATSAVKRELQNLLH